MDNYKLSRDRAQAYFLGFDQQKIIADWNLPHDEESLYVDFLGRPYSISRSSGTVTRQWSAEQAGFEEVLSIFDLLCHESAQKRVSGRFAPVNSLKGRGPVVGVGTNFHGKAAARFDRDTEAFRCACLSLGAAEIPIGDMGFQFPLFQDLTVKLKFYRADEDFPASVTLLWEENLLQYIYYETVFYIAGFLLNTVLNRMENPVAIEGPVG